MSVPLVVSQFRPSTEPAWPHITTGEHGAAAPSLLHPAARFSRARNAPRPDTQRAHHTQGQEQKPASAFATFVARLHLLPKSGQWPQSPFTPEQSHHQCQPNPSPCSLTKSSHEGQKRLLELAVSKRDTGENQPLMRCEVLGTFWNSILVLNEFENMYFI